MSEEDVHKPDVSVLEENQDQPIVPAERIESNSSEATNAKKPKGYWKMTGHIQDELQSVIAQLGHFPSQRDLDELGKRNLKSAVAKSGGFGFWSEKYGYGEKDKKKYGFWKDDTNIEEEIRNIMKQHGLTDFPTVNQLQTYGAGSLRRAIFESGGIARWREKFGYELKEKSKNYWTADVIEREAREFVKEHGGMSQSLLGKMGRFDLLVAIGRRYEGGLSALKTKLGIDSDTPSGYWTKERIREEAEKFVEEYGDISYGILLRAGKSKLKCAIDASYPGHIGALKKELNLADKANPPGYWTEERIIQLSKDFYTKYGDISYTTLAGHNEMKLYHAIASKIPGGLSEIREQLGLIEPQISPDEADEMMRGLTVE